MRGHACYAWPTMSLRFVFIGLASLSSACIANTIELESDPGDSGSGTTADPDTDGTPTTGRTSNPTTADETSVGPVEDTGIMPREPMSLLLAIETSIAPGLPLQGFVTATPGNGTVDLTLQWLSLDVGSTTSPRLPIGDVYAYPGIPIEADGSFTWETGVLLIPGAANSITGSDLVATVQAQVVPSGSPWCGRVAGVVTSPIEAPLDGSTHAMTEVRAVDELPLDFPVSCP